jgi:23S rRNA (cytidine1920-2'-O)/16S rRNA (cytidine1409-2'-O)-methyltransferase
MPGGEGGDQGRGAGETRRLDVELVRRGLSSSRAQAQAAIAAGKVSVGGVRAVKPGQLVTAAAAITSEPAHPWVSRGGVKLAHALDFFGVTVTGLACLDVGASTGGFTEVLLTRGARRVVAVDVGRGQLADMLAADARVLSLEGQDARQLTLDLTGEPPQLIVCDASFIGLAKILPAALALAHQDARLIALFKPQFEVGPAHVGKGGIVTDVAAADRAAAELSSWLAGRGWEITDWTPSPITGGDGNAERLFIAKRTLP